MNDLTLINNEFLRQFEIKLDDSLARIEYSEQERKIFLTKLHIPEEIKDKTLKMLLSSKFLSLSQIKTFALFLLHQKLQDLLRLIAVTSNCFL